MRRKQWVGLAAAVALAAGLTWVLWPAEDAPGINVGTYRRIQIGMTAAEVEALVGRPAGDHTTQPRPGTWTTLYEDGTKADFLSSSTVAGEVTFFRLDKAVARGREWRSDDYVLLVALEGDRVAWKQIGEVGQPGPGVRWWRWVQNLVH